MKGAMRKTAVISGETAILLSKVKGKILTEDPTRRTVSDDAAISQSLDYFLKKR